MGGGILTSEGVLVSKGIIGGRPPDRRVPVGFRPERRPEPAERGWKYARNGVEGPAWRDERPLKVVTEFTPGAIHCKGELPKS
jgi:hypothetical protein